MLLLALAMMLFVVYLYIGIEFRKACGFYPDEPYNVARLRTRYWTYVVLIHKSGKWEHTVKFFRFHEKPEIKLEDLVVKVCSNKASALYTLWLICCRLQNRIAKLKVVKSVNVGETYELFELLVKVVRITSETHVLVEDLNYCGHRMVVPIRELKKWW